MKRNSSWFAFYGDINIDYNYGNECEISLINSEVIINVYQFESLIKEFQMYYHIDYQCSNYYTGFIYVNLYI